VKINAILKDNLGYFTSFVRQALIKCKLLSFEFQRAIKTGKSIKHYIGLDIDS